MNKFICGFLWKEYKIMRSRITSSVISGILVFFVLYSFFENIIMEKNSAISLVSCQQKAWTFSAMILAYLSSIFIMKFREEKLSGIMEIELSLPISMKKIVVVKLVCYLIIINIFMLLSLIGGGLLTRIFLGIDVIFAFNVRYIIIQNVLLLLYGVMNAYATWCCGNFGYKLMLMLSNIMICIILQGIWKMFLGNDINGGSIIVCIIVLLSVSVFSFLKLDKEKAILSC